MSARTVITASAAAVLVLIPSLLIPISFCIPCPTVGNDGNGVSASGYGIGLYYNDPGCSIPCEDTVFDEAYLPCKETADGLELVAGRESMIGIPLVYLRVEGPADDPRTVDLTVSISPRDPNDIEQWGFVQNIDVTLSRMDSTQMVVAETGTGSEITIPDVDLNTVYLLDVFLERDANDTVTSVEDVNSSILVDVTISAAFPEGGPDPIFAVIGNPVYFTLEISGSDGYRGVTILDDGDDDGHIGKVINLVGGYEALSIVSGKVGDSDAWDSFIPSGSTSSDSVLGFEEGVEFKIYVETGKHDKSSFKLIIGGEEVVIRGGLEKVNIGLDTSPSPDGILASDPDIDNVGWIKTSKNYPNIHITAEAQNASAQHTDFALYIIFKPTAETQTGA